MMKPENSHDRQRYGRLKNRVFEILETTKPGGRAGKTFAVFITSLIIANIIAVVIETVPQIGSRGHRFFSFFEALSVGIFSVEYLFRLWSCTSNPRFSHPLRGRMRYMISFMALVDLAAVLPFYVPMLVRVDLRFLRALRLFRLFRILKISRYSRSMRLLRRVLYAKRTELGITVFTAGILLIIVSSLMYLIESRAQPDKFTSIPSAMWWAVTTLTTVGYGDYYPITPLGKILGGIVAMLGIGLFALPAGILGAGFVDELARMRAERQDAEDQAEENEEKAEQPLRCPHCGKEIHLEIQRGTPD